LDWSIQPREMRRFIHTGCPLGLRANFPSLRQSVLSQMDWQLALGFPLNGDRRERLWQKTPRSTTLEEMSSAVSFKLYWRIVSKAIPLTNGCQRISSSSYKVYLVSSSRCWVTIGNSLADLKREYFYLVLMAHWWAVLPSGFLLPPSLEKCTVFNEFGTTAINCPRSLQILYCQKKLFCTLQRIYSTVAILPDYLVKKSLQIKRGLFCSVQTNVFPLCKKICCDCKTLIAQSILQNHQQKTATILGSAQLFSNNYNVHSRIQLHWKSLCRR
jgi:hypothetical protein